MNFSRRALAIFAWMTWLLSGANAGWAINISGVLYGALDQPQINVYVATRAGGPPLLGDDGLGGTSFNVTAFYDTGASGILISDATYNTLSQPLNSPKEQGLTKSRYPDGTGPYVVYQDVGVGGSESFNVSQPIYLGLAKNSSSADVDNMQTYTTVYNQSFGPVRAQIAMPPSDPLADQYDIVGTPCMAGKVVVMDPKPLDAFAATGDIWSLASMQTYVYNPRTPFNAALADSEPGIPATNRHLRLSSASMDRFTQLTPNSAPGPTLANNPFLGPNPVAKMDGAANDTTPGVTISFDGQQSTGSFLFDTGAATSMISSQLAAKLHVRYVAGTQGTDTPKLETFDPLHPTLGTLIPDQFQLAVGGVGGTSYSAGFYVDSMLLRTMEGDPGNDQDPNHLRFVGAPVLVTDITVQDPITQKTLTLDGVFGVNNWVASLTIENDTFGSLSPGNFNWAVFDQPNGVLGLDVKSELLGAGVTNFSSWHGDGTAGPNWSNSANWESGTPAAGNGLRFTQSAGTTTSNFNDFADGTRFNGIVFSGPSAFNLQGHRIALWGNLINISTATQTISLDMDLNGAASTFNADSGNIVVAGRISGSQGIVKTGSYTLTLSGTATYTGDTTISAGKVIVTKSTALPDGANLTIGNAAAFAPITGVWAVASSGNWTNGNNWTSQVVPNGAGQIAVINPPTSTPVTITLDAAQTVGALQLGNSASSTTGYTLSGTAASTNLTLNNMGAGATISVSDGQHAINAPIVLADNLTVTDDGSNSWTLTFGTAGGITESGHKRLVLNATQGKLILSGTGQYTGGTFVAAGKLIVTNPAAIADKTDLTIGNNTTAFASSIVAGAAAASVSSATPVPESGTLALLTASAVLMALRRTRWKMTQA
jgi:autotransporter-associated beta strand protein